MSLEILIWVALAVLLIMGTPIFVSLGMASITVLLLSDIPLSLVMIDLIDARRDNSASSGMITSTKTELQIPQ